MPKGVYKRTRLHKLNTSLAKRGEKHPNWKGDKVGYNGVHNWMKRHHGQPQFCEFCKSRKEKMYDWANIDGKYRRYRVDWLRLCRSCHIAFDKLKGQVKIDYYTELLKKYE